MTGPAGTVAVFGATGQQGGATVDALLAAGARVRALVRDTTSETAAGLADRGVDLREVSVDDADTLRDGFRGAAAAFVMTTFTGPDGTDGEVRMGRALTSAAAEAEVPFLLYSSVGGAERHTGIPHFESKRRIEEHAEGLDVTTCFLRPVFFMDNFASVLAPSRDADGIVVRAPMPGDVPLQVIGVPDIGKAAAALLVDPASAPATVEIGTDELTGEHIAAAFGVRFGASARYEALPLDVVDDDDAQAMFGWFAGPDSYHADFVATRGLVPDAADFSTWLRHADIDLGEAST